MPKVPPVRVGLIGCGTISAAYLRGAATFDVLDFVALADLDPKAALRKGDEFGIPAVGVEDLLADASIEAVVNLTIPSAHANVNSAILDAGKHAYCEKPFALDVAEGRAVIELAASKGLRIGCAPDTFLGGGHQSVRHLIDNGAIGDVVAGTAFMMGHGHESWHPNPGFYYAAGGGPLFDMGPYYLTALVQILGPVKRVAAITGRAFNTRLVTSKPLSGERLRVDVDTHTAGTLEFANGAIVTVVMSFDVWFHSNRFIELHGTAGSLSAPDPNQFGGNIWTCDGASREWREVDLTHGYTENLRSIGFADMCVAIRQERDHRCSGDLAFHILEVMEAFERSSKTAAHVSIDSAPPRPAPLPLGLTGGALA